MRCSPATDLGHICTNETDFSLGALASLEREVFSSVTGYAFVPEADGGATEVAHGDDEAAGDPERGGVRGGAGVA